MSRPQRARERGLLSPLDALDRPALGSINNNRVFPSNQLRPLSSSSSSSSSTSTASSLSSAAPRGFWAVTSVDELEGQAHAKAAYRRFSEQDIKTRNARAALPPTQKHKSTVSYPIYTPNPLPSGISSNPPSLPWVVTNEMEHPPRLKTRASLASMSGNSIASQSSFQSRQRSPLSISSSIDYESSRRSEDSSYSNHGKPNVLASRSSIPPTPSPGIRRMQTEPTLPTFTRYGAGGQGRQQMEQIVSMPPPRMAGHMGQTILIPPRLTRGPPSPTSPKRRYTPRVPGDGFKKLPEEILLVVLTELKKMHLDTGKLSCSTCWMRDLTNLGLTCQKWWRAARIALYEDIQLNGCDSVLHTKKKFKIKYGTRLKLLRRTLTARQDLADLTKSLKVPAMPEAAKSKKEQDEYMDLVASIIMACPNLERLPGFYPTYNHEFSRFVHALSTRRKLVEKVWVINPSPFQRQHRYKLSENSKSVLPILAPGPLMPEQCIDLLTYHSNWRNLQTLVVHCNTDGTIDSPLFTDIFWSLPALENLHVSSFPAPSFNDATLLSLPPLKSLRLDNLPGITGEGLSSYAAPLRTDAMTHLSLISVPLVSLPVLARLFSHLKSLTHFTLSQPNSPTLPSDEIYLHPYLATPTLQYLHWEFTNPDDDRATDILSKSITYSGFPSLRTLRAPTDHDGTLQRLCKPRERIELPADRYRNMGLANRRPSISHSQSTPSIPSPTRSTFSLGHGPNSSISSSTVKSPTRSTFSLNIDPSSSHSSRSSDDASSNFHKSAAPGGMSLSTARRMAQARIEDAKAHPRFQIVIWDENGQFVERFAVGAFLGSVQSEVWYSLKPDVEGCDEAVWGLEGTAGLLERGEEEKDGCTGSWNLMAGMVGRKNGKGKDRWWHTERGRWREVGLEKLF